MQTAVVRWTGDQKFLATSPSGHAIPVGMLDRAFIQFSSQPVQNFQFRPHRGWFASPFAGTDHFQRFQLLTLLPQHNHHGEGGSHVQHRLQSWQHDWAE